MDKESAIKRWNELNAKIQKSPMFALDEFGNTRLSGVRQQLTEARDAIYNEHRLWEKRQ